MQIVEKGRTFLGEVVVEMKKITWPSREDLRESTVVVIVSVAILAVVLGIVDRVLTIILNQILKIVA